MTAPDQIFASPDREDGWRWPRASQFPEQGPYENVSYTRSDLTPDPAAIREVALREAAAVAEALSVKWWGEYKNRLSPHCADPHYQGMSDGASDVATAIEALIGEKK
jgi:hypothetical protein